MTRHSARSSSNLQQCFDYAPVVRDESKAEFAESRKYWQYLKALQQRRADSTFVQLPTRFKLDLDVGKLCGCGYRYPHYVIAVDGELWCPVSFMIQAERNRLRGTEILPFEFIELIVQEALV